jgi:outer membrane protein OmpA-like peptidoglycan-associated protein
MRKVVVIIILIAFAISIAGCASMKKRDKGVLIGAGAGAVIGGIIGKEAGNTAAGAIIGAAIGGAAGGFIGHYMDKQAEEIEKDIEGAKVERIGEGIKITFDSGILFDVNKSDLKTQAQTNLLKLAEILNKYEDTEILIEGHTDSTGPYDHNIDLSLRRAQMVANNLAANNVATNRFTIMGYGPDQPVEPNDTASGRQANRRVDLAIYANDKLKSVAKKQTEEG